MEEIKFLVGIAVTPVILVIGVFWKMSISISALAVRLTVVERQQKSCIEDRRKIESDIFERIDEHHGQIMDKIEKLAKTTNRMVGKLEGLDENRT